MEFTREIQGGNTYLVYQIRPEDQIDTLGLGMIVNNKIEGIAPTIYSQMDSQKYLKYNISAKVPLNQFFMGTVGRKRLLRVIDSVLDGMIAAEDYMLESRMLLLHSNFIFVDVSTGRAVLICVPLLEGQQESVEPGAFFKAIMFDTQFDQSENGDYIAKIIGYLNSTAQISITDFSQLVKGLLQEDAALPGLSQEKILTKGPAVRMGQGQPSNIGARQQAPAAAGGVALNPLSGGGQAPAAQRQNTGAGQSPGSPLSGTGASLGSPLSGTGASLGSPLSGTGTVQAVGSAAQKTAVSQSAAVGIQKSPAASTGEAASKEPAADFSFAIPGGGAVAPEAAGKKDKKKKEKKEKKEKKPKETVTKEKPPKEKKGFSLFGKKKKEAQFPQTVQQPGTLQVQPPNGASGPGSMPGMNVSGTAMPMSAPGMAANSSAVPMGTPGMASNETAVPASTASMATGADCGAQNRYADLGLPAGGMGETTVLGNASMGETVVLSGLNQEGKPNPRLTRVRSKERIIIDKPVFRIGKERSYVDYFIGDNPAISRSHANIIIKQDGYYLEDMNSTNHTYVNDNIAIGGSAVKLEQGARIRLGNEEFVFEY